MTLDQRQHDQAAPVANLADLMLRLSRAELVSVDDLRRFASLEFDGLPAAGVCGYRNITGITPWMIGLATDGREGVLTLDLIAYKPAEPLEQPLPKATQLVLWRLGGIADFQLALEDLEN